MSKWHPTTKGTLRRNYRVPSKTEGRRLLKAIASLLSDDDHFTDATSHKVLTLISSVLFLAILGIAELPAWVNLLAFSPLVLSIDDWGREAGYPDAKKSVFWEYRTLVCSKASPFLAAGLSDQKRECSRWKCLLQQREGSVWRAPNPARDRGDYRFPCWPTQWERLCKGWETRTCSEVRPINLIWNVNAMDDLNPIWASSLPPSLPGHVHRHVNTCKHEMEVLLSLTENLRQFSSFLWVWKRLPFPRCGGRLHKRSDAWYVYQANWKINSTGELITWSCQLASENE